MSPKTKQVLFTPQMVAALLGAVIGAGGGTFGGFSAGSQKAEVQAYRLDQLELSLKAEHDSRLKAEAASVEYDKRLTLLETQAGRFEKQLNRFDSILDRMKK